MSYRQPGCCPQRAVPAPVPGARTQSKGYLKSTATGSQTPKATGSQTPKKGQEFKPLNRKLPTYRETDAVKTSQKGYPDTVLPEYCISFQPFCKSSLKNNQPIWLSNCTSNKSIPQCLIYNSNKQKQYPKWWYARIMEHLVQLLKNGIHQPGKWQLPQKNCYRDKMLCTRTQPWLYKQY